MASFNNKIESEYLNVLVLCVCRGVLQSDWECFEGVATVTKTINIRTEMFARK